MPVPRFAAKLFMLCVFAFFASFLGGCHTVRGVLREVNLPKEPKLADIKKALHGVPQIETIAYMNFPSDLTISMDKAISTTTSLDQFYYQGKNVSGTLEIQRPTADTRTLRIYYLVKDHHITPAELTQTRELMDKIYASLQKTIPDMPAAAQVKETIVDGSYQDIGRAFLYPRRPLFADTHGVDVSMP